MTKQTQTVQAWQSLVDEKKFITDMGMSMTVPSETKGSLDVDRYAVWLPLENEDKHQIVEVGANLKELQLKHNVPDEDVFKVSQ